jgi:hypothetical protein
MKSLERAARRFGIESPDRRLMRAKIIDQGTGYGGLADAPFIGTNEDDCWSGHSVTLPDEVTDATA